MKKDKVPKANEDIRNMLTKKSSTDVAIAIADLGLKIMCSIMPIPPACQTVKAIGDFVKENFGSTTAQRNQLEFLITLFKRLDELEEKINADYIKSEEFEIYVLKCMDHIKYEQYKDKGLAFKNALINISVGNIPNNFEKEYFMNNLIAFTDLHFALLSYFNNPKEKLKEAGLDSYSLKLQEGGEKRVFQEVFQNVEFELLNLAVIGLKQKGFISLDLAMWGSTSTRNVYESLIGEYRTELGKRFINFWLDNE